MHKMSLDFLVSEIVSIKPCNPGESTCLSLQLCLYWFQSSLLKAWMK